MGNQAVRVSNDWNEIIDTLEEIQLEGSPMAIWDSNGDRSINKAVRWTLDTTNGQIDFHQEGGNFVVQVADDGLVLGLWICLLVELVCRVYS